MKTKLRPFLAALALAAPATSALAADGPYLGGPYMGIQGSYQLQDRDRGVKDGYGGTLVLGVPVGTHLAAEMNVFGLTADDPTRKGGNEQYGTGLDVAFYPFSHQTAFAPFVLAGGGGVYDDRPGDDSVSAFGNVGAGVLMRLNQATSLRVDAKRYMVLDDGAAPGNDKMWDTRINAGIQIAFGARQPQVVTVIKEVQVPVAAPTPPPPPPPPPAPVDSDQDGVIDPNDACPGTPYGMKVDDRGCAIKTAKLVLRDINFEFDSSKLLPSAMKSLDKVVDGLRGQPTMMLKIEGHTDSKGTDAYNLKLSQRRAAAAREYLVSQGIDGSRLVAAGMGEGQPVSSNATEEGRAENRRVEFSVTQQ